jgi:hypothetical protein
MTHENEKPRPAGISTFYFVLLILIIAVVPVVLHQIDIDHEKLKTVGRACAAFAGVLLIWGFFARLFRMAVLVLAALVALGVLVSEGVIKPPLLVDKIEERKDR